VTLATAFTLALTDGAVWGAVIRLVRTGRSGGRPARHYGGLGLVRALTAAAVFSSSCRWRCTGIASPGGSSELPIGVGPAGGGGQRSRLRPSSPLGTVTA
jgi:hypothetical protein